MQELSKQIYERLDALVNGLQKVVPFSKVDLAPRGLPNVNLVVFESAPEQIKLILSRYETARGKEVANPCLYIIADPVQQTANVNDFLGHSDTYQAVMFDEPVDAVQRRNNRLLFDLLQAAKEPEENCDAQFCLLPVQGHS